MSRIKYNDYFPPYKAAVDAGAGSVMATLMKLTEFQLTGNKWLMTEVLETNGALKVLVTDYTGIPEMSTRNGRYNSICLWH
jgi:beta-glucosidase